MTVGPKCVMLRNVIEEFLFIYLFIYSFILLYSYTPRISIIIKCFVLHNPSTPVHILIKFGILVVLVNLCYLIQWQTLLSSELSALFILPLKLTCSITPELNAYILIIPVSLHDGMKILSHTGTTTLLFQSLSPTGLVF